MRWAPLVVVFVALIAWAIWRAAPDPEPATLGAPADAADPAAGPHRTAASPTEDATRKAHAAATAWWLPGLDQDTRPPLLAVAGDRTAAELRGRLTSRQRPWIHPANVDVRLTRSWLDTVLPAETGDTERAPARTDPVARTDEHGHFTLRLQPGAGELFLLIDPDGLWMDFQKLTAVPAPGTTLDLGEVLLDDRGGIQGQLFDPSGLPLANVAVRAVDDPLADAATGLEDLRSARTHGLEAFQPSGAMQGGPVPDWVARRDHFLPFPVAKTDAEGRFTLRGLRPGTHDLFFGGDLASGSLRDVLVAALRDTQVGAVVATPHDRVRLRFLDPDKPWVGAGVVLLRDEFGFGPPVVHTDVRGEIQVAMPRGKDARILFSHPGGGPWLEVGRFARTRGTVYVTRPQPTTILLADAAGAPVVDGSVRLFVTGAQFRPVDRALPTGMQPVRNALGMHLAMLPCNVVAVASAPGFAPAIGRIEPGIPTTLVLLPLQTLAIRTRDPRGHTVAAAEVRMQVHDHPDFRFPGAQWEALANDRVLVGTTDSDGRLEVAVWPTFVSLQASHPDYAASPGPKLCPIPGDVVDLVLLEGARIRGQVRQQQREVPAGLRVRARQRPPPGHPLAESGFLGDQLAVTGPGGTFAFRDLCAGIWELTPELPRVPGVAGATTPAAAFRSRQVLLDEGQELHLLLEAERETLAVPQLQGIVRSNGVQASGLLLRIRPTAPPPPMRRTRNRPPSIDSFPANEPPPAWAQSLVTDHFGDFEFAGLALDTVYELRVELPIDGRLQFVRSLRATTPKSADAPPTRVEIDITTGALEANCIADGRPFANRMIRLRQMLHDGGEGARFEVLTDAYGRCLVDHLPTGTWTAEPMHGGLGFVEALLEIRPGVSLPTTLEVTR